MHSARKIDLLLQYIQHIAVLYFQKNRKEIPPSYQKLFGKLFTMRRIPVLNETCRPILTPTKPVPPDVISASMKNYPFFCRTHHRYLTKERNSPVSAVIKFFDHLWHRTSFSYLLIVFFMGFIYFKSFTGEKKSFHIFTVASH